MLIARIVIVAIRALRSACLPITRDSRKPRARAEVTKSADSVSIRLDAERADDQRRQVDADA